MEELLRLLNAGQDQAETMATVVEQLVARGQLVSLKGGRLDWPRK